MKSKFRSDFLKGALIGCIGLAICIPVAIYAFLAIADEFAHGCTSRELDDVEEWGRFKIPESATATEACFLAWQDYTVDARFEIPASDLEIFLKSTKITQSLSTTGKPANIIWKWDQEIDAVENYLYGRYNTSSFSQEIFVDTGNPER